MGNTVLSTGGSKRRKKGPCLQGASSAVEEKESFAQIITCPVASAVLKEQRSSTKGSQVREDPGWKERHPRVPGKATCTPWQGSLYGILVCEFFCHHRCTLQELRNNLHIH